MRLHRNSDIVRYWKCIVWWRSDAEKAKTLAEGTNLCVFVKAIMIGTITAMLYGVMLSIYAILTWSMTIIVALPIEACCGFVPVRWNERWRRHCERWALAALCWEFEDRLHLTVRGRKLYPWHALAVIALGIAGHALVDLWSIRFVPAFHQLDQEQSGLIVLVVVVFGFTLVLLALVVSGYMMDGVRWFIRVTRSSDAWRVLVAWLRAKKDRVCPRVEFVG
ncbi:MAG: hypothetical protein V1723_04790 [Candidatus Uhrbacteria bacterium]